MYVFYPVKSSTSAETNEVCQKYQNLIKGDPYKLGQTPPDQQKIKKSNTILEGSRYPNFTNHYGKSFLDKLFPKKFGTLTPI